jgi:hypothetical protein
VELYLERVIPKAARDHGMTEGAVQAVVSKSKNKDWAMLDREVTPSFADSATKSNILGQCMQPLVKVVAKAPVKHTTRPARFGAECDLLALDRDGRVLAIEVKPATSPGVAWVAGQAAMYARVLQEWIHRDATPDESTGYPGPRAVLEGMLAQRQALGHARGFNVSWTKDLIVTPVVVLQRGVAPVQRDYMLAVRDSLAKARIDQLQPVEIYEVSILGDFERVA